MITIGSDGSIDMSIYFSQCTKLKEDKKGIKWIGQHYYWQLLIHDYEVPNRLIFIGWLYRNLSCRWGNLKGSRLIPVYLEVDEGQTDISKATT